MTSGLGQSLHIHDVRAMPLVFQLRKYWCVAANVEMGQWATFWEYLDRRACRSKMRDCRDEEKKGRDRRHETVNAEGMYECDLQVHEIDRETHA
jgi:hypothetical protein